MSTTCPIAEPERTDTRTSTSPDGRPVLLACGQHLVSCRIGTNGHRVSDVLNDAEIDYLRLSHVRMLEAIDGPATAETSQALVIKKSIDLLLILDQRREADIHRYRRVQKSSVNVVCCAGPFQLRGSVRLPAMATGSPDPVWMLNQQLPQFFALTGVELLNTSWHAGPAHAPVVIVNSDSVDLLAVEKDDTVEELLAELSDALAVGQYRSVLEELGF